MKRWSQPIILFILGLPSAWGFFTVLGKSVQGYFSVIKSKLRRWSPEGPQRSLPWGRFYVIIMIDIAIQEILTVWVTRALRGLWSHLLHTTQLACGANTENGRKDMTEWEKEQISLKSKVLISQVGRRLRPRAELPSWFAQWFSMEGKPSTALAPAPSPVYPLPHGSSLFL